MKILLSFSGMGKSKKEMGWQGQSERFEMFCLNATGLKSLVAES